MANYKVPVKSGNTKTKKQWVPKTEVIASAQDLIDMVVTQ